MSIGYERDRRAVRYEARATVMFGAYTVWAAYADGSGEAVAHGTPQHCLETADRLNRELDASASRCLTGISPPSRPPIVRPWRA